MPFNLFKQRLTALDIAVFDLETTGLHPGHDHIIQIALVHIRNGVLTGEEQEWKVNPGDQVEIPPEIIDLTGLDENELRSSPGMDEVFPQFGQAVDRSVVAGHNVGRFDLRFIHKIQRRLGVPENKFYIDTCLLSRRLRPNQMNHKLATCATAYGLEFDRFSLHDALADTRLCAQVLLHQVEEVRSRGVDTFEDLLAFVRRDRAPAV
jgi:DNA polymerase III epsilon subunit family exonuclease